MPAAVPAPELDEDAEDDEGHHLLRKVHSAKREFSADKSRRVCATSGSSANNGGRRSWSEERQRAGNWEQHRSERFSQKQGASIKARLSLQVENGDDAQHDRQQNLSFAQRAVGEESEQRVEPSSKHSKRSAGSEMRRDSGWALQRRQGQVRCFKEVYLLLADQPLRQIDGKVHLRSASTCARDKQSANAYPDVQCGQRWAAASLQASTRART